MAHNESKWDNEGQREVTVNFGVYKVFRKKYIALQKLFLNTGNKFGCVYEDGGLPKSSMLAECCWENQGLLTC